MNHSRSQALFEKAQRLIPGGVNSPVRAFRAVGGNPPFIARAEGSRIYDVDGNTYIDYVGSWGPMILGHGHPAVVEAVDKALRKRRLLRRAHRARSRDGRDGDRSASPPSRWCAWSTRAPRRP